MVMSVLLSFLSVVVLVSVLADAYHRSEREAS